jgi:hypothetical protein
MRVFVLAAALLLPVLGASERVIAESSPPSTRVYGCFTHFQAFCEKVCIAPDGTQQACVASCSRQCASVEEAREEIAKLRVREKK